MKRTLYAPVLFFAVIAIYRPAWHGEFLWDDPAHVQSTATTVHTQGWSALWRTPGLTQQYYPLTFSVFGLEHMLFGENPTGYHFFNCALHAANAVLVGFLLAQLSIPAAWFCAFWFAVHPMHVESVAWISELKNLLSTFFFLLGLLAIVRDNRSIGRYITATLLYAAALLSKTTTVGMPIIAVGLIGWRYGPLRRRDWIWLFIALVGGLPLALQTAALERLTIGAAGVEWSMGLMQHIGLACRILWFYPVKLLWPSPLIFMYPRWGLTGRPFEIALWLLVTLAMPAALWKYRRRMGWGPLLAAVCYAILIFPALGFVNVYPMRFSWVSDHFAYLASIPILALAGSVLVEALHNCVSYEAVNDVLLGLLVVTFGTMAAGRALAFSTNARLWNDTLAKNPDASLARTYRAMSLADQGHLEEALGEFDRTLKRDPDFITALANRAACLARMGRTDEALAAYQDLIARHPDVPGSYFFCAEFLRARQRWTEAFGYYRRSLDIAAELRGRTNLPEPAVQRLQNAHALEWLAIEAEQKKDWQTALRLMEQAIAMAPEVPALQRHHDAIARHLHG